jgi:hypothetical protein
MGLPRVFLPPAGILEATLDPSVLKTYSKIRAAASAKPLRFAAQRRDHSDLARGA